MEGVIHKRKVAPCPSKTRENCGSRALRRQGGISGAVWVLFLSLDPPRVPLGFPLGGIWGCTRRCDWFTERMDGARESSNRGPHALKRPDPCTIWKLCCVCRVQCSSRFSIVAWTVETLPDRAVVRG